MIGMVVAVVAILVFVGLAAYLIHLYNRFQALRVAGEATLSQIRVALRKRLDMISQLVEAAREYAQFEREMLESVTKMRTAVATAAPEEVRDIDRESGRLLARVLAVAEAYPTLRTAEPVSKLMDSIKSVEDEIARLRYTYNNIAQEYNTRIYTFPSRMVARMVGAAEMPYLEVGGEELEERPHISLRGERGRA